MLKSSDVHCDMKIQFCTSEDPVVNRIQVLGDQNLIYATIGNKVFFTRWTIQADVSLLLRWRVIVIWILQFVPMKSHSHWSPSHGPLVWETISKYHREVDEKEILFCLKHHCNTVKPANVVTVIMQSHVLISHLFPVFL